MSRYMKTFVTLMVILMAIVGMIQIILAVNGGKTDKKKGDDDKKKGDDDKKKGDDDKKKGDDDKNKGDDDKNKGDDDKNGDGDVIVLPEQPVSIVSSSSSSGYSSGSGGGAAFIFGKNDIERYCHFKQQLADNDTGNDARARYFLNIITWGNGFFEDQAKGFESKYNIDCTSIGNIEMMDTIQ